MHDNNASIRIPKLDCSSLRITTYSNAVFSSYVDVSSQFERRVLLTVDYRYSITVSNNSYQSRRVARSLLCAEVIDCANLFDDNLSIHKQLEFIVRQHIPIHILMDSKGIFDMISRGSCTNLMRVMLDLKATQ